MLPCPVYCCRCGAKYDDGRAVCDADDQQTPAVYKIRRAADIRAALRGDPYPK